MIKRYLLLFLIHLFFSQLVKAQYCLPTYAVGCAVDYIDNFSTTGGTANITNLGTGCSGSLPNSYTFYNTMTVSQTQGSSFNFTVQSGIQAQGYAIWIDWNQDFDFDDFGEDVYFSPGSFSTPQSGIINIPATATPGTTRMRVISNQFGPPSSTDYCGSFVWGECEDYNVDVVASVACAGLPIAGTINPIGPLAFCAGQSIHLGLTGTSVTGGLIYNWQQSTNSGLSWSNVIGGTGGTGPGYITPILTSSIWYKCTITCTGSGLSSSTPPLVINVSAPAFATVPYVQSFESWTSVCDVQDVPNDLHWSNVPLTGNASWRREDEGFTANWLNPTDGFYLPSSSDALHSARYHSYGTSVPGDFDLYLNCNTTPAGNKTLTFDYINDNYFGIGFDSLEVMLSTNGGLAYTTLGYYKSSPAWSNQALIISSNTANTIVRFRAWGDNQFDTDMGIDKVNIMAPCSGMPNAGVIDPVSPCINTPFTLTLTGATISGGINYIWESAPSAGGPWTLVNTTASPLVTTTVSVSTYFRCRVECQGSGLIAITPVIFAQLASFYNCYCISKSETNAIQQNIGNVSIYNAQNVMIINNGSSTPLLNNPSLLNYYSNFYALTPTTLYRDSVYDLIETAFSKIGTFTNGYSKVYIDFNHDGVFDPITENVGGGIVNAGTQSVAVNIHVPLGAPLGTTAMRIVYRVGGSPSTTTPCGTYPSGETEDYLVNISLPPCLTPPFAGNATVSDTITCPGYVLYMQDTGHDLAYLNLSFNWQYSNDGITYTDIPGAVLDTLSYIINNESWFRFRTTCNGTSNGYSDTLHVLMNPSFACYGQSSSTGGVPNDSCDVGAFVIADSSTNVDIYSFFPGPGPHLLNPAAVKNRTDRTGLGAIQLFTDSAYKFKVYSIMRNNFHADAKVTIFIDYNNNQVYDIPQERVFSGIASTSTFNLIGEVRTPAFPAINSNTGMRIIINNDVGPNASSDNGVGLYTSGETEDYLVLFKYKQLNSDGVNDIYSIDNIGVYPNPTTGITYIGLTTKEPTTISVQVLSITGALLSEKKFDQVNGNFVTPLDLSTYAKGTYLVKINSNRGNFIRRVVVE